ncbi:hypothetical protein [Wolbachia endosymbiont of Encarsia formosa]|uniref:hypothetical protein n=1 Tax=Wolbachia endosymbiont of Encarsia formosa TaxID=77125 RepID=UPI0031BA189F
MDKAKKNTSRVIPTFKARVEDLPESLAGLKTNVNKAVSGVRTNAESLSKLLKDKFQDTGKIPVNVKTKRKYEVEDLPKFFKDKSKEIGKVFSDEVVEISTIRSKNVTSDTQEFSFKIKLLTEVNPNTILPQIKHFIDFFKICLSQEKNFTANIKVAKESEELYNNYHKANKTVEEFISNASIQILLQSITITLQTDVKNINLGSLQQIEALLNDKLKHVEKAKSEEQSQDTLQAEETENKNENVVEKGNTQGNQIVQGSFGYNIVSNRKQITRAPVIVAAMHENISWFRSLFQPFNFFNTAQFFFPQLHKFSIQSNNMPPGVIPALDQKEKEPVLDTRITDSLLPTILRGHDVKHNYALLKIFIAPP